MPKASFHGGARAGAGRPSGSGSYGEPTRPLRVPESQVEPVVAFLAAYREGRALEEEGVRAVAPRAVRPTSLRHAIVRYAAKVPAGFPSPADDYIEDVLDFNAHLVRQGHEAATFVVRASGWSMIGAGIHDGDEIVVDRALQARDGHVVVAAVNGELIVKRLRIRGGKVLLVSENPHYPERVVAEGEHLEVWGVATRVLHKL
jgi:DNA polymerase V